MKPAPTHPAVTTEHLPLWLRVPLVLSLMLISSAIFLVTLYLAFGFDRAAIGNGEDSPPKNAYGSFGMPVASPLAFPPYPTFPARLEMVMLEPTPTATSVVPTKVPTQSPFLCPLNPAVLPQGTLCTGAPAPLPTPMPPPPCISTPIPNVLCRVVDSVVRE